MKIVKECLEQPIGQTFRQTLRLILYRSRAPAWACWFQSGHDACFRVTFLDQYLHPSDLASNRRSDDFIALRAVGGLGWGQSPPHRPFVTKGYLDCFREGQARLLELAVSQFSASVSPLGRFKASLLQDLILQPQGNLPQKMAALDAVSSSRFSACQRSLPINLTSYWQVTLKFPCHTSIRYNGRVRVEKIGINFSTSALGHNEGNSETASADASAIRQSSAQLIVTPERLA